MIFIPSNAGNYTKGRDGHAITRGYFHRTAVKGDTALGEANRSHNVCVKASYYIVIDLDGNAIESTLSTDTEWAVDEWDENEISVSYEFTGLNGTPLTAKQIATAIKVIKADKAVKKIANHRLTISEIPPRKVSGWANHHDITTAYKIAGGHTDGISEAEISQILAGIK